MKFEVTILIALAVLLFGPGGYVTQTARGPDDVVGSTIPIIFGVFAMVAVIVTAIIQVIRQ